MIKNLNGRKEYIDNNLFVGIGIDTSGFNSIQIDPSQLCAVDAGIDLRAYQQPTVDTVSVVSKMNPSQIALTGIDVEENMKCEMVKELIERLVQDGYIDFQQIADPTSPLIMMTATCHVVKP